MINKIWLHCLQFEGFVLRVPFIFTVYTAYNFMSAVSPTKSLQISQFHYHKPEISDETILSSLAVLCKLKMVLIFVSQIKQVRDCAPY